MNYMFHHEHVIYAESAESGRNMMEAALTQVGGSSKLYGDFQND
jgi:hypothetical protein